jgi:hypothetical protein
MVVKRARKLLPGQSHCISINQPNLFRLNKISDHRLSIGSDLSLAAPPLEQEILQPLQSYQPFNSPAWVNRMRSPVI